MTHQGSWKLFILCVTHNIWVLLVHFAVNVKRLDQFLLNWNFLSIFLLTWVMSILCVCVSVSQLRQTCLNRLSWHLESTYLIPRWSNVYVRILKLLFIFNSLAFLVVFFTIYWCEIKQLNEWLQWAVRLAVWAVCRVWQLVGLVHLLWLRSHRR